MEPSLFHASLPIMIMIAGLHDQYRKTYIEFIQENIHKTENAHYSTYMCGINTAKVDALLTKVKRISLDENLFGET